MLFISLRPWTFYLTFPSVRLFLFGKTILTSQVDYKIVWHNLFKADTEFPVKGYCKLYHNFYYLTQCLNNKGLRDLFGHDDDKISKDAKIPFLDHYCINK